MFKFLGMFATIFTDWNDNCRKRTWSKYKFWLEPYTREWKRIGTSFWTWIYWTCQSREQVLFGLEKLSGISFPCWCLIPISFLLPVATWQLRCKLFSLPIHLFQGRCHWPYFFFHLYKLNQNKPFALWIHCSNFWFWDCCRYFSHQSLKMAFEMAPADPTLDLNMQLWVIVRTNITMFMLWTFWNLVNEPLAL